MKYLLGIDIGTSGCKVVLTDTNGRISSSVLRGYRLLQPEPGWTEQEPVDWWEASAAACRELLATSSIRPEQIAGVGLTGQMHSLVTLDSDNQVIRPAILWNDQRTVQQCAWFEKAAGGTKALLELTGNRMLTGYTGGKLCWLRDMEPENYRRIHKVLITKDYIRFRLTGKYITDESDASGTGLFDVKRRCWSEELLERVGLAPEMLPQVVGSAEQTGVVTAEAAQQCGLAPGTPVYGGAGDAVISLLGAGITAQGRIGITLGTSGVVAMTLNNCLDNSDGKLQVFCGTEPNSWAAIGCTLAAAGSYQWLCQAMDIREQLSNKTDDAFQLLDQKAAAVPPGSGGMLYFPYLLGERCPLFNSDARAAFIGIDATMNQGHFARAVLEGVAFSLKQVYDLIASACVQEPQQIVVCGGGAKSRLWRQILADLFSLPVITTYGSAEGGAYGAAVVAGIGTGIWTDAHDACRSNSVRDIIEPEMKNRQVYAQAYSDYCNLYRKVSIKK